MTIRHLKTFIIVAKHASITKAAQELNIAQPSVTQTIKELEEYYNVQLFNRINKKLVITDEGLSLLVKAKTVVEEFNNFESIANEKNEFPSIKIGATLTFGKRFIPEFVRRVKEKYPNIDLHIKIENTKILEEKLLTGDLDFALCEGLTESKDIKSSILKKDRLVLVSSIDYDIPESINFSDLINYDLLLRETGSATRYQIDSIARSFNIKLKPLIDSISNYTIILSILKGIGVGILPYPLVKDYLANNQMKEIKLNVNLDRNLYIIFHKGKTFTGLKKQVLNICLKYIKELNEIN